MRSGMFVHAVVLVLLGALCAAPTLSADSPWPAFQYDSYNTGNSPNNGPDLADAGVRFRVPVGAGENASPVIGADGTVYIGSIDGCLYGVSITGDTTPQCLFRAESPIPSTPAISEDGTLYFCSEDGVMHAVTPAGDLLWQQALEGTVCASPVIGPAGSIYIGTAGEGILYCLHPLSGAILWQYPTGSIEYCAAVDTAGNVYAGTLTTIFSFTQGGSLRWSLSADDIPVESIEGIDDAVAFSAPPVFADKRLLVPALSMLLALDTRDGSELWRYTPAFPVFISSPAVAQENGRIFIGGISGVIHCIDRDGTGLWVRSLIDLSDLFNAVDPENPEAFALPLIYSPPAVDTGNRVYVRAGNRLYAYTDEGASLKNKGFAFADDAWGLDIEPALAIGPYRGIYTATLDGDLVGVGPEIGTYSISGTVTGADAGSFTIALTRLIRGGRRADQPVEQTLAVTGAGGEYMFPSLYPGSYLVTPLQQGFIFDPPSRDVRLQSGDVNGIDFTAYAEGPVLFSASAEPSRVPNDGVTYVVLKAEVGHRSGETITGVCADLSAIGGSPEREMRDDGSEGDAAAGDGVYTLRTVVPGDVPIGLKQVVVTAEDGQGRTAGTAVTLEVINTVVSTLEGDYEIYNPIEGQTLIITYANNTGRALVLNVFSPSNRNNPVLVLEMLAEEQTAEIADAEEGIWLLRVQQEGASSRMAKSSGFSASNGGSTYSIQTSTAGIGAVFGTVVDGETGVPLDGVVVSTTAGTSAVTENGFYLMLSPAGQVTVVTSAAGYLSSSRTVSLLSGASVPADFVLREGGGGGCPVEDAFPGNSELLSLVRRFRDTLLNTTPGGTACINAYYLCATSVARLARYNSTVRDQIAKTMRELLPAVERSLDAGTVSLTTHDLRLVADGLKTLYRYADPDLQDLLRLSVKDAARAGLPLEGIEVSVYEQ